MKRILLSGILQIIIFSFIFSQGSNLPLGNPVYSIIDRLEIKTGFQNEVHSDLKTIGRLQISSFAQKIDTLYQSISLLDRNDLNFVYKENNEWLQIYNMPITLAEKRGNQRFLTQAQASTESRHYIKSKKAFLKQFYKTPANLMEVNDNYFYLRAYPIFYLDLAPIKNEEDIYYYNRRGFEFRGGVDERIYFYFNLLESQAQFPNYVDQFFDRFRAIPGEAFIKPYSNKTLGFENGYDFLNGQGYVGFNMTKHSGIQIGHGKNFIGNGYRSLLLSDFSNNYFYVKLNWKIWKFHYQNIFAELSANSAQGQSGDLLVPKKYMAAHYLSFNASKNFNVGLFEVVVFDRENHFEFQYLNPIILYRTIEQAVGSPDNVLLGLNFKANFFRTFQLYGQLIFDEIKVSELTSGNGWWANKFGVQAGLKYINAFKVDHLDFQVEWNTARPYTFTHLDSLSSYTHYNQPLAHPLGANFKEIIFLGKFQPAPKWTINARAIFANYGEDNDNSNWGKNLLRSNDFREQEYGNSIGQGIRTTSSIFGMDLSYQLSHNVFLDAYYFSRNLDSFLNERDQEIAYFGGGFRVNINRQRMDF